MYTHTHTPDALRTEGSLLSHHCSDHPFIPTLHREIRKPVSTAGLSFSVQRHRRLRAAARPLNAALKHVLLLDTGTVNRAKTRCIVCACRWHWLWSALLAHICDTLSTFYKWYLCTMNLADLWSRLKSDRSWYMWIILDLVLLYTQWMCSGFFKG